MKTIVAGFLLTCILGTPASAQSTAATTAPVLVRRPTEGALTVEGSTAPTDTYTIIRLKVFMPDGSLAQSIEGLVQPKHDFIVALRALLTAGQSIEACAIADVGELVCSNPLTVSSAAPAAAPPPPMATATPPPPPNPCPEGLDNDRYGPIVVDAFTAGATKISGSAPLASGSLSLCVNGALQKLDNDATNPTATPVSAGKWTAQLKTALKSGDVVRVLLTGSELPPARLSLDKAVPLACTGLLQFTASPKEGQTQLYAMASPSSDSLKCAVSVYINGDASTVVDNQGHEASSIATDSTGQVSVGLKTALDAGQCVALLQFTQGQRPSPADIDAARQCKYSPPSSTVPVQLVASSLDLGRARTYFTSGVVMAANGGNFNSQNLFLDFTYDKNWLWGGPAPLQSSGHARVKRIMLNTFFEARLTAVPINTIDCTATANAALAACKTTTAVPVPATPIDTFIASRKAAELEGGAYMPIIATTWTHDRDPYAFTIGPIAKAGFITPTDTVDANGNTVATLSSQTFYTSYGFGARLGLSKLSYSHDVAPDLVSYVDVVSGRFSQFDNNVLPYGADPAAYRFHRPWRFALEGAFKIPTLPFVIGVSANVHQNFGLGKSDSVANARDDLRFFFGTKFDLGSLLGKLKSF
jgi:hypothetical protein